MLAPLRDRQPPGHTGAREVPRGRCHVVGLSVSEIEFPSTSGSPSYDIDVTGSFAHIDNPETVALTSIAVGTLIVANVLAVGPALAASGATAASLLKAE
jgi:hypothetical protein